MVYAQQTKPLFVGWISTADKQRTTVDYTFEDIVPITLVVNLLRVQLAVLGLLCDWKYLGYRVRILWETYSWPKTVLSGGNFIIAGY